MMPSREDRPAFVALPLLAFALACQPVAEAPGRRTIPATGSAAVHLTRPTGCASIPTVIGSVDVEVRFEVVEADYPAPGTGVAFLLDGADQPFAVVQSMGPVVLAGIAPGRHRLAACLVTRSGDGTWRPAAACTCDLVTVDVVRTGCSQVLTDPITDDPKCDPAAPVASCCLDANPCSTEACDVSSGTPTCAFANVSPDCCLSDLDCGAGQFCHLVDDPSSIADDALAVHRCASCDQCPAAGATCPAVCGACPSCATEDACGGGACAPAPPAPEPGPEPLPEARPEALDAAPAEIASKPDVDVADGMPGVEKAPEAPGYTIDVSLEPEASDAAGTGGNGSCGLARCSRPDGAAWSPMVAVAALAFAFVRARVRATAGRRGS